jgi:hypothetical protein
VHPRIATIQHVVNKPAFSDSVWSSHEQTITKHRLQVKTKVPDTFSGSRKRVTV